MTSRPTRYTCEIIFHRATNVSLADLNNLSSDPYVAATLQPLQDPTGSPGPSAPHRQHEPSLSFRTSTTRKTLNPAFDARWLVSGIPASGFVLVVTLLDEDPGDHDDRLGKAVLRFPDPNLDPAYGSELKDGWHTGEREYKVHKRHGSLRTRIGTYIAKIVTHGRVGHRVRVVVSVRVLGEAPPLDGEDGQRIYTLGPHIFVRHYSPLATHLTSVQSFKANRLQLTGPVPSSLRHRYVGFAPFVKAMFRKRGIEGIILNHALHKQHHAIYKWDKNTVWGVVEGPRADEKYDHDDGSNKKVHDSAEEQHPDEAFARKFLEMAEYGTEGRIFTYVIMLDGQFRFTETGEEFAIGLLSKHTMHADVAIEIAYSGEFFVRRVEKSHRTHGKPKRAETRNGKADCHHTGKSDSDASTPSDLSGAGERSPASLPPSAYELIIDNDSGTYRPRKDLLPVLEEYLSRPSNFGALGRVRAMDGFDEKLKQWKEQRKEEKKRARGGKAAVVRQASISSSSSSSPSSSVDEDAVASVNEDVGKERRAASGSRRRDDENEEKVMYEDAERAEANEDDDDAAKQEKQDALD